MRTSEGRAASGEKARPLLVANPYALQLTFVDDRTRTRRDHLKHLTLIRTLALLHQYQREVESVDPPRP